MSTLNWQEILGWSEDQIEEVRFAAFSYFREGKYDIAQLFFESLIIFNPNSFYDLQTLGAIYLQTNQEEKAIEMLDRALQISPTDGIAILNKAKAFFALNRLEEGLQLTNQIINNPNHQIADDAIALQLAYR